MVAVTTINQMKYLVSASELFCYCATCYCQLRTAMMFGANINYKQHLVEVTANFGYKMEFVVKVWVLIAFYSCGNFFYQNGTPAIFTGWYVIFSVPYLKLRSKKLLKNYNMLDENAVIYKKNMNRGKMSKLFFGIIRRQI